MSKTETPDIVERLQTAIDDRGKGSVWGYAGLLEDATAEIERLRSELAKHTPAALAAEGLVVVPREPTQAMLDAIVTYPAELVAARNDPAYTAQMHAATAAERALAAQRYRAMIAAAREDRAQPDLRLYGRPEQSAELPVTTRLGALL